MRCADINSEMYHSLGVSKPILNYVIFCHQEDSNWPLEEGSKVKVKFDEIFASAKYNDCLKKIKDVRAGHMNKDKLEKAQLVLMAEDRKMAVDKRRELQKKEANKCVLQDQLIEIEQKMSPIQSMLNDIRENERNFVGIQEKIASSKSSLHHCQMEIAQLLESIDKEIDPDMTDDAEIEQMKSQLQFQVVQKEKELQQKQSEISEIAGKIRKGESEGKKIAAKIGESKSLHDLHEKDCEIARQFIEQFSSDFGWKDDNEGIEDEEEALERIKKLIKEKTEMLKVVNEKDNVLIEAQRIFINDLEIKKANLENKKQTCQKGLIKLKQESARIRRELNELEGSTDKLGEIQTKLETKTAELEQERRMGVDRVNSVQSKTIALKNQLRELEGTQMLLKEERSQLDSQRHVTSEISVKKDDLADKRRKIERIMARKGGELSQIFEGVVPKESSLKDLFGSKADALAKERKELEVNVQTLRADLDGKRGNRRTLGQEVETKLELVRGFKVRIGDIEEFEEELEVSKQEVDRMQKELSVKEANKFTYKEFVDRIESMIQEGCKTSCPTCHRQFHQASEAQELLSDLKSEIKRIPGKVHSIQNRLNKAISKRDRLQNLLPDKRQADALELEINSKREILSDVEREIKKVELKLQTQEDKLDILSVDDAICEDLREEISNISMLYAEVIRLEGRIGELESDIAIQGGQLRDYSVVKEEEETIFSKIVSIRKEIESNVKMEIHHEKRMNALESQKNTLLSEKLAIEAKQQERSTMLSRRSELEQDVKETDEILKGVSRELWPLKDDMDDALKLKDKLLEQKRCHDDDLRKEIEGIRVRQTKLTMLVEKLLSYEKSGNDERMKTLLFDHKRLGDVQNSHEKQKTALEEEKRQLELFISNQEGMRRQIEDNIRLRKYRKSETQHQSVTAKLESKLNSMDYHSVKRKKDELERQKDELEAEKHSKTGRLTEMNSHLRDLHRELRSDKLSQAETRYKEKNVLNQCRVHAIRDLDKYYKALNYAIIRFHQERMKIINRFIRELWRSTYKGNDIDYIEIQTDDADSNAGADKRKVYNYRVVMVKNEAEMEMRGRCSAGQKVLASLIIRLALAETFSSNCGMIALDEPTTNLDRDNIESFAESLAEIVTKRSQQQNFQLIVITHDEELIDHLGRAAENVEHYYKVSRNNFGHSEIRKHQLEKR